MPRLDGRGDRCVVGDVGAEGNRAGGRTRGIEVEHRDGGAATEGSRRHGVADARRTPGH